MFLLFSGPLMMENNEVGEEDVADEFRTKSFRYN